MCAGLQQHRETATHLRTIEIFEEIEATMDSDAGMLRVLHETYVMTFHSDSVPRAGEESCSGQQLVRKLLMKASELSSAAVGVWSHKTTDGCSDISAEDLMCCVSIR